MKYLLDTNVVSEVVRPAPNVGVTTWLAATPERDIAVSVMTVGEIERGILRLGETRRAVELRTRVAGVIGPQLTVLDLDRFTLLTWARLMILAETQGRPPSVTDAAIAATCAQHGLTLVTRNTRDFAAFGVSLIDPWHA